MPEIQLIAGLGNPGSEYEPTRHNAGFWFVDELAKGNGQSFRFEQRFQGELARCMIEHNECRLIKPTTFMNRSGQAVGGLARFFKVTPKEILVVHDELDLPAGTIKLKKGGGHGGHNGLRDTINQLGSKDFYRLRLGIGHPGSKEQVVGYVLGKTPVREKDLIESAIDNSIDSLALILNGDMQKAMNQLHTK